MSITYLAKGLANKGHEIHIACEEKCLLWQNLEGLNRISLHPLSIKSYFDFAVLSRLRKIVVANQVELINAQGGKDRNLVILAKWIFKLRIKIVFTRRQRPRNEPWIKRWYHMSGVNGLVMVSEGLKSIFIETGYSPEKLKVIHNGVPPEIIPQLSSDEKKNLREKLGISSQVVGCLSRLKIQGDIIKALKYLPEDLCVLFVGIERNDLQEQITQEQPKQKLMFTGPVRHEEALQYLQIMDVNILSSHMEGFGLVLVEAMMSRVPVVASNFGGIPDIIDAGENGFLYEIGNSEQLANKTSQILNDEQLKSKFIESGYKKAMKSFTIEKTIKNYEQYFNQLIRQN